MANLAYDSVQVGEVPAESVSTRSDRRIGEPPGRVEQDAVAGGSSRFEQARAVSAAMGEPALTEALARSVAREPSPELVCALAITATARSTVDQAARLIPPGTTAVPGFPATDLFDEHGPWQRALTPAAEHGLLVPAALLNADRTALWRRAHRWFPAQRVR